MKVKLRHLVPWVVLFGMFAWAAAAQTATDEAPAAADQLVARWTTADARCRGPVPAIDAVGACEQRDTLSKLLAMANYCHDGSSAPPHWTLCTNRRNTDQASIRTTVQFQRMGGVFVLSARLDGGTQAYFIVDSGAATVQIPQETVEAMKRNGTLADADFMGERRFILADGRAMQQRVFRLRSLQIGDRTMENVLATMGAPRSRALLGQSFLRRLNWWKIDNVKNAIEFEFTGAF
jgi:hypothetical protein